MSMEKTQCLFCMKIMAAEKVKPNKLKRRLDVGHAKFVVEHLHFS